MFNRDSMHMNLIDALDLTEINNQLKYEGILRQN